MFEIVFALLGLIVGALLSFAWQQVRWKKEQGRWEQQNRQLTHDLAKARTRAKQLRQTLEDTERRCWTQMRQRARPETVSSEPVHKSEKEIFVKSSEKSDFRKTFQPEASLQLIFQYQLPDSLILKPGEGYLLDARNRLIPDEGQSKKMNTAGGYAMDGLFYLFDVKYRGRQYGFQQILDGEMGGGYVRIRSVDQPAQVVQVGATDCYGLATKGLLTVADV